MTYNYRLDYSFKSEQRVSILTLQGRVIVPYRCYDQHLAFIQQGAAIRAARPWYDKPHKQFYLLISLEMEVADPTPEVQQTVVGVDVGRRYLATTTTMFNTSRFYPGKRVRTRADLIAARNIALRTLLIRQDWVRPGVLSVRPDVSSDETKAARLARYAELRWSLDISPSFQGWSD